MMSSVSRSSSSAGSAEEALMAAFSGGFSLSRGRFRHLIGHGCVLTHAKNSCALMSEAASASTSSLVLYMANEARQVAVRP